MVIMLLLLLLSAGLASWRGLTVDSRDTEYGLRGLVGSTAHVAPDLTVPIAAPDATLLVVPAAWLPEAAVIP